MNDDVLLLSDLAPVRAPTTLFEHIEQLAEERRMLLHDLPSLEHPEAARRRLAEIDHELEELWAARRRELHQVGAVAAPVLN